jgi:hypothetical protein
MLHIWLVPVIIVGLAVIWGFYLLIRNRGGSGVRTDGRTVLDKPDEE